MFRLQHYRQFLPQSIDVAPLSPGMRDMMRALLMPFPRGDVFLGIFDAAGEQLVQSELDKADEPEALVITALFTLCHNEVAAVFVGELAGKVNACLKNVGEEGDLKPRAVGAILKSLGLATQKVNSLGRGIILTHAVKRRIHQLLRSYNLAPSDSSTIGCVLCEEMEFSNTELESVRGPAVNV